MRIWTILSDENDLILLYYLSYLLLFQIQYEYMYYILKLFVLFLFLKETMEYENPSIHSTMYQFNTYKIMLLAPLKTQAGGKETE